MMTAQRERCAYSQRIMVELDEKAEGISVSSVKKAGFGETKKILSRFSTAC